MKIAWSTATVVAVSIVALTLCAALNVDGPVIAAVGGGVVAIAGAMKQLASKE